MKRSGWLNEEPFADEILPANGPQVKTSEDPLK